MFTSSGFEREPAASVPGTLVRQALYSGAWGLGRAGAVLKWVEETSWGPTYFTFWCLFIFASLRWPGLLNRIYHQTKALPG